MPTIVPGFTPPAPRIASEPNADNRATMYTGHVRYFDGVNDYIGTNTTGAFLTKTVRSIGDFTISISFYSSSVSNYRNVFDMNFGFFANPNTGPRLEQTGAGELAMIYSSATSNNGSQYTARNIFTSSDPLRPNTWYHITMTRTGTTVKFYVNGYEKSTVITQQNDPAGLDRTPPAFNNLNIGRGFSTSGERYFNGYLSNFKVFDVALTAEQVLENFQKPETGAPNGVSPQALRVWWKLNEGDTSVVYDHSFSVGTQNLVTNSALNLPCQSWELSNSTEVGISNNRIGFENTTAVRIARQYIPELKLGKTYRVKLDTSGDLSYVVYIGNEYYSIDYPKNRTEYHDIQYVSGEPYLRISIGSGTGRTTFTNIELYEVSQDVPGYVSGATTANEVSVGFNNPGSIPQRALDGINTSRNSMNSHDLSDITVTSGALTYEYTDIGADGRLGYFNLNGLGYRGIGGSGLIYYSITLKRLNSDTTQVYVNGTAPASVTLNLLDGTYTSSNTTEVYVKQLENGWWLLTLGSNQGSHYSFWPQINNNIGMSCRIQSMSMSTFRNEGMLRTYSGYIGGTANLTNGMEAGKDANGIPFRYEPRANSFNFSNTSGYVRMYSPSQPTGNQARTLEAWVFYKPGSTQSIVELGNGNVSNSRFGILISNGYIYIVGQANDFSTLFAPNSYEWNHIVASYDGFSCKVYCNNALVANVDKTGAPYNTGNVGVYVGNNSRLDEPCSSIVLNPKVYNYALSAEQVQSSYNEFATTTGAVKVKSELQDYVDRTVADGATVESHSCLLSMLNHLDQF